MSLEVDIKHYFGIPAKPLNLEDFDTIPKNERRSALGNRLYKRGTTGYCFMPVKLGGVELPNPIIRLTGRKEIEETTLVERGGSVKEIISLSDYVINIKGIIKNTDGTWPDAQLSEINDLWQQNAALKIDSVLTSIFMNGNEYAVLKSLQIPDTAGSPQISRYEMELVSDTQFTLEIPEDETNYGGPRL